MGDWPRHIIHAQHGKIKNLNEVMGVYRIHAGGLWSGLNRMDALERNIEAYRSFNVYLDRKYKRIIDARLADQHIQLAALLEERKDILSARSHLKDAIRHLGGGNAIPRAEWLKMFIRLYFPVPYRICKDTLRKAKS